MQKQTQLNVTIPEKLKNTLKSEADKQGIWFRNYIKSILEDRKVGK